MLRRTDFMGRPTKPSQTCKTSSAVTTNCSYNREGQQIKWQSIQKFKIQTIVCRSFLGLSYYWTTLYRCPRSKENLVMNEWLFSKQTDMHSPARVNHVQLPLVQEDTSLCTVIFWNTLLLSFSYAIWKNVFSTTEKCCSSRESRLTPLPLRDQKQRKKAQRVREKYFFFFNMDCTFNFNNRKP